MSTLSARHQIYLGLSLAALMAATRSQHFADLHHLPEASWAVFLLAGFYLRPVWAFPALCGVAAAVDWLAIGVGGESAFCVTPAYAMLVPAYGALWLGGRWYSHRHRDQLATLLPLTGALLVSAFAAELISSGSFYFLGGRFAETSLAEFAVRLGQYFPANLGALALYAALAVLLHALVTRAGQPDGAALGGDPRR